MGDLITRPSCPKCDGGPMDPLFICHSCGNVDRTTACDGPTKACLTCQNWEFHRTIAVCWLRAPHSALMEAADACPKWETGKG